MHRAIHCIPPPRKMECSGSAFDITAKSRIVAVGSAGAHGFTTAVLREKLRSATGFDLPISSSSSPEPGAVNLFIESGSDRESYRISVMRDAIELHGDGGRGLFWAVQTLSQIAAQTGASIPGLRIDDAPDFACRGFYHDVTRGKVPKLETLKLVADMCASFKLNHLQLYVEHAFAFRDIEPLWEGKTPLTAGEITELDRYCRERHVELVPSLATFGHLYELLRLPQYEHLNELDIRASRLPHSLWDRMAHYTLDVGQEESFSLVKGLIEEYLPLFSSPYFNICCDETFDLGTGKNRERANREGTGRMYVDFVKKVMVVVMKHGKVPMFWGDIIVRHPELIGEIPREAVFLNWNYGPRVTADVTRAFAEAGVTQFVCPGVSGWSRFFNDIDAASANIRAMTGYGKKYGAAGVLTTDWGDCGHVNFLANSFHGLALGASLSWNAGEYEPETFDRAVSRLVWGDISERTASLLRELGNLNFFHLSHIYGWVSEFPEGHVWNASAKIRDTAFGTLSARFTKAREIVDGLAEIAADAPVCAEQDFAEFMWSGRATAWAIALTGHIKAYEYAGHGPAAAPLPADRAWLLDEGLRLVEEFTRLWRVRNKESELSNVVKTFENVFEKLSSQHL